MLHNGILSKSLRMDLREPQSRCSISQRVRESRMTPTALLAVVVKYFFSVPLCRGQVKTSTARRCRENGACDMPVTEPWLAGAGMPPQRRGGGDARFVPQLAGPGCSHVGIGVGGRKREVVNVVGAMVTDGGKRRAPCALPRDRRRICHHTRTTAGRGRRLRAPTGTPLQCEEVSTAWARGRGPLPCWAEWIGDDEGLCGRAMRVGDGKCACAVMLCAE